MRYLIILSLLIFISSCKPEGNEENSVNATEYQKITVEKHDSLDAIGRLDNGESLIFVAIGTSLTDNRGETSVWFEKSMVVLSGRYPGLIQYYNGAWGASASKRTSAYAQIEVERGSELPPGVDYQVWDVLAHNPDVIFIEFAINDAYIPYEISLEMSMENLQELIDTINSESPKKVEIIVQTMNNVVAHCQAARPTIQDYYQGYRDIAAMNDVVLIDHNQNWVDLHNKSPEIWNQYFPDGCHANDLGAENVILPMIESYF